MKESFWDSLCNPSRRAKRTGEIFGQILALGNNSFPAGSAGPGDVIFSSADRPAWAISYLFAQGPKTGVMILRANWCHDLSWPAGRDGLCESIHGTQPKWKTLGNDLGKLDGQLELDFEGRPVPLYFFMYFGGNCISTPG